MFIEGTRSRIGKLLTPKFGILKIILDAVLAGQVDDCLLVPMSIDYDKVLLLHPKSIIQISSQCR